jgi:hypothetical protein
MVSVWTFCLAVAAPAQADPGLIAYVGVFLALLIAACYVQWDKYANGQGVNRVMAFTTVFFGFTITTVSELRSSSLPKSAPETDPNLIELRSLGLPVDARDLLCSCGGVDLSVPGPTVSDPGDFPCVAVSVSNHGCGCYNGIVLPATSSLLGL